MDIKIRESGNIRIVDLAGRLDTGASSEAEASISQLLQAGHNKIIINLGAIDYVSSSGLRVLLVTAKKLSAMSGKMKICKPNAVVREILDISGFSTILDVRASEEEALAELQF